MNPTRALTTAVAVVAAAIAIAVAMIGTRPQHLSDLARAMAPGSTPGNAPAAATARPATTVKPVSCEKLPNVPGKSISTVIVDFPPNSYTPRHRHPGSVSAFVLKGQIRSQLAGGAAQVYTVGQTWFEPPGTIHLFAENASATEPAQLLAVLVADNECGPLVIPD